MTASIQQFASAHNLKTRKDGDSKIIPGIDESHLYEYDESHLAVMYMDSLGNNYSTYRKECLALGMKIQQDGDFEFAATFSPTNAKQAKYAIQVAGCRFPGRRESTTSQKNVNWRALQGGTSSANASEGLQVG